MTLQAARFDYPAYFSVVRDRLVADGFDVDEPSYTDAPLPALLVEEASRLGLGLFASKASPYYGDVFCALFRAEGVDAAFVERADRAVRQLATLRVKAAKEAIRTFYPVIISPRFDADVVAKVEEETTVAKTGVEVGPGVHVLFSLTVPVLVSTDYCRVYFSRPDHFQSKWTGGFENLARSRVRTYFAP